jgi:hypothetical protein
MISMRPGALAWLALMRSVDLKTITALLLWSRLRVPSLGDSHSSLLGPVVISILNELLILTTVQQDYRVLCRISHYQPPCPV